MGRGVAVGDRCDDECPNTLVALPNLVLRCVVSADTDSESDRGGVVAVVAIT
jgi:hypothetical protein